MDLLRKPWLMAVFVLGVAVALRLPALWTPILDVDESQFAGFANTLLAGGTPYVDSVDTKPLGIYQFFAAVFLIFGRNNMIAVHAVTAIWVFLTAIFCRRIARALYSEGAGWMAALLYAVFTTTYIPKYISTSIMVIAMLPLTMSIYYMVRWESSRRYRTLVLAGLLFGIACIFKYQAGINAIVAAFYFLIFAPLYLFRERPRPSFKPFLVFIASGAAVGLAFFAYLEGIGAWDAYRFFSMRGSLAYVEAGMNTTNFFSRLASRGGAFVASTFLIWFFGIREAASLARHIFVSLEHSRRWLAEYLILFWFLGSIIPVCIGGRFFGHYFIQLMPALVILAAAPASRFFESAIKGGRRFALALFLAGLILPAAGFFCARIYADEIYTAIGEDNPNSYRPLGAYVRERTPPSDSIFVWGFATPVYFFADRPAASRFLWCDWLTGRIPGSPTARDRFYDTSAFITRGSWDMLFDDLERNRPAYFIDTSVGNYHDYGKYPVTKYPKLVEYMEKNYRFEARYAGADFYKRKD